MAVDDSQPSPSASRASSRASSAAGSPFIADPGPVFDPDQAASAAVPLQVADVWWETGRIRTILRAQGLLTHEAIGVGVEDWAWRDSELEAISEPAANALNKFPVTRAAAAVSDELTVGAVMFEYASRSIRERSRVLRAEKKRQEAQRTVRPPEAPQEAHAFDIRRPAPQPPAAAPQDVRWHVESDE